MASLPLTVSDSPVQIAKLVPGGQGISIVTKDSSTTAMITDGKKGFFWNALPGETVTEFMITKNKSHYFEAIALQIENENSHRIKPKDSCFLSTSPWQIMDYDYELEQKSELLTEIFRQAGLEQYLEGPAQKAVSENNESARSGSSNHIVKTDNSDFFYRNKMEYALYWDLAEEKIKLAFHQRGSHRKVPIETSSIERPEIFKKAQEIVGDLNTRHEEARKYQSLLLRCDKKGQVSGGLYENKKPHPEFPNLEDEIFGQKYSYSPNGFFQINLPVYEMALTEIKNYIKTDKVLDLYAGVGTIGLSVASDRDLTLVESNPHAYAELEKNTATGAREVISLCRGSEQALDYITPHQTVIVDPPRAGCNPKLLEKFLEVKPERIIYLSCNPATQARDLKILCEKYNIIKIQPYNFFPRTPHLENLVILDAKA